MRYYPTCVPRAPRHPGFDEPPRNVSYKRIETFADGREESEYCDALEYRRENISLAIENTDFIDEDRVAEVFAQVHAGRIGYCHARHAWFVWDNIIWRRDTDGHVIICLRYLIRDLAAGNKRALTMVGTAHFLEAAERIARSEPALALAAEAFDADPSRLGTPGGTVDLATGVLVPPDPADRISRATAVAPAETADCPLWRRFLAEAMGGDAAMVDFLQRFLGYALTGETGEHVLLFGLGEGGNGKSVFANTVRGIFGDYAVVGAPDLLTHGAGRRSGKAHSTEVAMLAGARLVVAGETEEGRAFAEGRLKLLTGGDAVTARFVGRDAFTFTPNFKLLVMGNHPPLLHTVDAAIRRRLRIVPFATRPQAPDRRLEAKLRTEWPAILRWMIEGCLAWRAEGLGQPPAVRRATDAYLSSQDLVGQFLAEACDTQSDVPETAGALYAAWCAYAKVAGETPGSQRSFAARLERRGLRRERTAHARYYRGVRLLRRGELEAEMRELYRPPPVDASLVDAAADLSCQ